ncbi:MULTISPECIES: tetratricopeptide repeat protein [unclassified Leucobacter]|uniref:tetratricopeptide repeat protein n=1 Tax=unclassified Leucobacter TaxID=2621730 RepID=UPI00165E54AD|nr:MULTISPECIES: sel1 repeat family protein [unclassified Leucobacter]MBC9927850.1 sel1 repeat family protein [Leucobacter sp. cx-169]
MGWFKNLFSTRTVAPIEPVEVKPNEGAPTAQVDDDADPSRMHLLGLVAKESGRTAVSLELLSAAAAAGYVPAMLDVGLLVEDRGPDDPAVRWWRQAADAGSSVGMFNLSIHYRREGNAEQGLFWNRKAAEAGDPDAMLGLAVQCIDDADIPEALHWTSLGSSAGKSELIPLHELLQRAANGDTLVMREFAASLQQSSKEQSAILWLTMASRCGDVGALPTLQEIMGEEAFFDWFLAKEQRSNVAVMEMTLSVAEDDRE